MIRIYKSLDTFKPDDWVVLEKVRMVEGTVLEVGANHQHLRRMSTEEKDGFLAFKVTRTILCGEMVRLVIHSDGRVADIGWAGWTNIDAKSSNPA